MDLVKIKELASRISYRPGTTLEFSYNENATCLILATKYVTMDANDHSQDAQVNLKYLLPYRTMTMMDEQGVFNWINDCLTKTAIHEHQEWYRVDGQMLVDPHANDHIAPKC
jgi:hypothetical protein